MFIKEIHINSFGCLENITICPDRNFNLIYGNNESGKSTLFAFIIFMFYGTKIKKVPGEVSFKEKYTPWNGKGMSGKIIFEHSKKQYSLERQHMHGSSSVSICCITTGEVIKNRDILDSPGEFFFGMNVASFYNSVYISGGDYTFRSMAKGELSAHLANTVDAQFTEATYSQMTEKLKEEIAILASEKRKNAIIPQLKKQISELKEKIFIVSKSTSEILALETENQELEKTVDKMRREIDLLRAQCCAVEESSDKQNQSFSLVIPAIVSLVVLIWGIVGRYLSLVIISLICLIAETVSYFLTKHRKLSEKEAFATKLFTIQQKNDKIMMLSDKIGEYNKSIVRNEEKIRFLKDGSGELDFFETQLCEKNKELEQCQNKLDALRLSLACLEEAYCEYKSTFSPMLSQRAGVIFGQLTNSTHSKVTINDEFDIHIEEDYGFKNVQTFSQGTHQQAVLAMRIALADMVLSDEPVPIFLDDALSFYDTDRLESTLEFLRSYSEKTQIIFSTCRKTEADILISKNVNLINF